MTTPQQVSVLSDFNTGPGGSPVTTTLLPEQAQDYFDLIEKSSIVQRVARKVPMGATGISIPHWNGSVSASWVGEAQQKPLTKGSFNSQVLKPAKIAVIFAESAEVVRANPLNYLQTMQRKIAEAIALAFDEAALYGSGPAAFTGYLAQSTQSVSLNGNTAAQAANGSAAYLALNDGLATLVNSGRYWTATLLDNVSEPILNTALDANGRPLFVEIGPPTDPANPLREGSILGRQTVVSDHVVSSGAVGSRTIGFLGDFRQVIWGQVGGLTFDVTDQATLDFSTDGTPNLISLWQHNMVAVRAEAEFAFLVNDVNSFVKITDAPAPAASGS